MRREETQIVEVMSNRLKRLAKPSSFNQTDLSSDVNMVTDPFHSSDDDKDVDYLLPLKKKRTAPQHDLQPSDVQSKKKTFEECL